MTSACIRRRLRIGVLAVALLGGWPHAARASDIIFPGFDLFDPMSGTIIDIPGFGLIDFIGVPLGTFDFGVGPVATGSTDTIIERLQPAIGPAATSIDIELRAMQMRTVSPVDLGAGLDFYYLTLQTGTPSLGKMSLTEFPEPPPGMPHSTLKYSPIDWNFDLRVGALGGPIVLSDSKTLTSPFVPWTHSGTPNAVRIDGVNNDLNSLDDENDFYPKGRFSLRAADGTRIVTKIAPEPGALWLLGLGLLAGLRRARQPRGRK